MTAFGAIGEFAIAEPGPVNITRYLSGAVQADAGQVDSTGDVNAGLTGALDASPATVTGEVTTPFQRAVTDGLGAIAEFAIAEAGSAQAVVISVNGALQASPVQVVANADLTIELSPVLSASPATLDGDLDAALEISGSLTAGETDLDGNIDAGTSVSGSLDAGDSDIVAEIKVSERRISVQGTRTWLEGLRDN